ncbi:MAG: NAD(P)H-dependent oxidoreductase [Nitrospinaceae bacterium]|jgi:NAD(P)H-dependent FMN reductase|nr:MAG: NAD(P)H-dependent oxidoreductase [Nitrospinaceae bacterium]
MGKILTIQGSLSPQSRTAEVLARVHDCLTARRVEFDHLDLRTFDLMHCDGRDRAGYNADTQTVCRMIEDAQAYIFGMPVYCWSISGPLKNLIDLSASGMENKVAGILCNAGSPRSFLASADLVKILFYESNVMTVYPIVHTSGEDFEDRKIINPKVNRKIEAMVDGLLGQLDGRTLR